MGCGAGGACAPLSTARRSAAGGRRPRLGQKRAARSGYVPQTLNHRCRRERPSSSTTVVTSSYPGSLMAKASVNHLIHHSTDVYILSSLSRVCNDFDQRIDRRTQDRCRLSCHELQSSPPLRLHLMPTSRRRPLHLSLWLHHQHHDTEQYVESH